MPQRGEAREACLVVESEGACQWTCWRISGRSRSKTWALINVEPQWAPLLHVIRRGSLSTISLFFLIPLACTRPMGCVHVIFMYTYTRTRLLCRTRIRIRVPCAQLMCRIYNFHSHHNAHPPLRCRPQLLLMSAPLHFLA